MLIKAKSSHSACLTLQQLDELSFVGSKRVLDSLSRGLFRSLGFFWNILGCVSLSADIFESTSIRPKIQKIRKKGPMAGLCLADVGPGREVHSWEGV